MFAKLNFWTSQCRKQKYEYMQNRVEWFKKHLGTHQNIQEPQHSARFRKSQNVLLYNVYHSTLTQNHSMWESYSHTTVYHSTQTWNHSMWESDSCTTGISLHPNAEPLYVGIRFTCYSISLHPNAESLDVGIRFTLADSKFSAIRKHRRDIVKIKHKSFIYTFILVTFQKTVIFC